ncbi:hypothetical protein J4443_04315 [Candidatus Woesearchaeota archaeon]|nr:hypothetical protein [Candidatus Woesearchaeota archaeon]
MPEGDYEAEKRKREQELKKLEERQFGESTVKRALIRHYSKKYKSLPSEERDKKVAAAIRNTIPSELSSQIEASPTKMGYAIGEKLPSNLQDIEKFIDERVGYSLIYDSFSEGLEPVYFWIVDFMRDNYWGTGLEVKKTLDEFQGAVGSGFFGDLGTRASIMQDRAMKMLTTINSVVRSIINILYDLKEFDSRLDLYKKLKSANAIEKNNARLSLKQVWMDRVDLQRGRGSINMLTQQLQFVTLRDAFMAADSEDQVQDMDLNDRVKRILAPRLQEYLAWEKLSEAELTRRYKIERSYLKSQVNALKLYSQWARPYLKTAQQLTASDYRTADLVSVFNNMQLQVSLFGKKQVKPSELIQTTVFVKNKFANIKLPKKIYSCVEITMTYRTIPHTITRTESGTHYAQGGRINMKFRGFALDEDEVDAVEKEELYQGLELIESMTKDSLESMQDEIAKYLEQEEKETEDPEEKIKQLEELINSVSDKKAIEKYKKEIKDLMKKMKHEEPNILTSLAKGLKEISEPLQGILKPKPKIETVAKMARDTAKLNSVRSAYAIYLVYKKAHGMFTE